MDGERVEAETVVCALPAGPLRDVAITGVSTNGSPRSAASATHSPQRPSSPTRARLGLGGATSDGVWASVWIQREGILSSLTPPDRLGPFLATPEPQRRGEFLAMLASMMGDEALEPLLYGTRTWGLDAFTQGYVTGWRPGDVMAVGPLHGTHEPPFYVCGSDQWVAGYMEGAVRTGRDAAARALGRGPLEFASALTAG